MNRIIPLRQAQERELVVQLGQTDADALTGALQVLITWLAEPMSEADPEPTSHQRRQAIRNDRLARCKARNRP